MNEDTTSTEQAGDAAEVELSTSVSAARASNLRETNPELFGGEKKAEAGDDAGADAGKEGATTGDEHADDETGSSQQIPRARLNEEVSKKKILRQERDAATERADALQAKLDQIEADRVAAAQAAADTAAKLPARDIEAELEALQQSFEDGEIESDELHAKRKELNKDLRQQLRDEAVAEALAAVEQRDAKNAQQTQAQQWESATAKFFDAPENAAYKQPIRVAALNEAMKVVSAEHGGKIGYDELLAKARDSVEVAFGGKPSTQTAGDRVAKQRREAAALAAAGVSSLPERPIGGEGERSGKDGKEVDSISRAEWRKLPQAKKDEMLGKTAAA